MTTKILTGTYTGAYPLAAPITTLSIASTGKLEAGVTAASSGVYTVVNQGLVEGSTGLSLIGAGFVTNSGTIGTSASNFGVYLESGGSVTNSAAGYIGGEFGVDARYAELRNFGTINATRVGARMSTGATTNGNATDAGALIVAPLFGFEGDATGASTLVNYGTVEATGKVIASVWAGAYFLAGGRVTNGSTADTLALIEGPNGVVGAVEPITVVNFATIAGTTAGAYLEAGGLVVNHAGAVISGSFGFEANAVATLNNSGTVTGCSLAAGGTIYNLGVITSPSDAIFITGDAVITNGSATDTIAQIDGTVFIDAATATVRNFGRIQQANTGAGVEMFAGGSLTNGSASDASAVISGAYGVSEAGGTVSNFATIGGATDVVGLALADGALATNGDASHTKALIEAKYAGCASGNSANTVHNFGTIVALLASTISPSAGMFSSAGDR